MKYFYRLVSMKDGSEVIQAANDQTQAKKEAARRLDCEADSLILKEVWTRDDEEYRYRASAC